MEKFNFNKDKLMEYGNIGLRIGKKIVVEGTKVVLVKGATKVITTSFEDGIGAIKDITLDDVIGKPQDKGSKKKWFSKKSDVEQIIEEVVKEDVKVEVDVKVEPKAEGSKVD